MGAERDRELFAADDARRYGVQSGDRMRLGSVAHDLGVTPETIDGIGNELNLTDRTARLETISGSIEALLTKAREDLQAVQSEIPGQVADFLIRDQLPVLDADHGYDYFRVTSVYSLELSSDNGIQVKTDLTGGPSISPYTFGQTFPLSAEWVGERLAVRGGVERDAAFCEQVQQEVLAQMMAAAEGGLDG